DGTARWPRLGCAPAERPAVARLRAILFADRPANDPDVLPGPPPGRQRVLGLTLLAIGGRPLAHLPWVGGDLDAVRGACAVAGIQLEYRWQPRVEAAELAAHCVPVLRSSGPPAAPRDRSASPPETPPETSRGSPPDTGAARRVGVAPDADPGPRSPAVGGPTPGRGTRWLYAVMLLVLAVLVLAVALLSAH
ncbi:MAG TPA: hypothetical protein VFX70_05045, partial [Mycobacteriales bacterium]|nr:hypothetical protein [Mycobacteriales bacterium]